MGSLIDRTEDISAKGTAILITMGDRILDWMLTSGLRVALIVGLGWVLSIVARRLIQQAHESFVGDHPTFERTRRGNTIRSLLQTVASVGIGIAASMMVLNEIGVAIGPILATAGIGGLAIGFGAQSLVKDVISGFFLLLEDQFGVGDVVELAGKGGVVEKITLRTVRLRDLAGNVHVIPNGQIDVVTNMTKDYSRYVFEVGIAYREDTDEVCDVLRQVGADLQEDPAFAGDIVQPLEILGVDRFDDSAVVLKARITTKPIRQWTVGREFNRRMKRAFDERGIEIPFPHVTLYPGRDKDGGAPPLVVRKSE